MSTSTVMLMLLFLLVILAVRLGICLYLSIVLPTDVNFMMIFGEIDKPRMLKRVERKAERP